MALQARDQFARGECVGRIRQVDEIVKAKGTPWFVRYGLTMEDLHGFRATENWHFRYGGDTRSSGAGCLPADGDVY